MRYILRQKFWAYKGFQILDENEQIAFVVQGKFLSWVEKLRVLDARGEEVAYIKQTLLSVRPRYEIFRDGRFFAEITKEFSWFKSSFSLDVPGPNDYEITGSFWEHEYEFKRRGSPVATVSKKLWSWSDTYGVEIVEDEDDIAILAAVIVVT